jgi:hypothetical protein
MMNYYVFDANGYTDVDTIDAEVGDAFNGVAKSANWDLEKLSEGKLSVTSGVEFNSIYFKDVFAESFVAETVIYPIDGVPGYDGRYAGFFFLGTNGTYYTMMLDMRASRIVQAQDGRNTLSEFGLVTLTEAHSYWEQVTKLTTDNTSVDVDVVPAESGVRFKIIKDRSTIHYFVDDEYFYSETLDFAQGKVYAGLFNMNVYADYEEFWCMPLEGEALEEELNNCDIYKIGAQVTTAGGYVDLSKDYAVAGENIDLKIVTDSGYKVSSVTCNGEDVTQNVSESANKGVYSIKNVNENTDFDVSFEKLDNAITYKGRLVAEGNNGQKEYISGSVILVNKSANEQRYEVVSTANRGFEVKAEAGEYELFVDGYFGSISVTLSESMEEAQEIQVDSLASVEQTNIHHMNLDFVNSSANTVKGQQGQWFIFDNASDKVYASAKIYNYDLDGFTIETEDGANVQFYFGYQGFFILKNYDWVTIETMDSWDQYGFYTSANKMKILNPTNVEGLEGSLVEIAIVSGHVYVAINGIGKANFELCEFSSSFTAEAKYHIGFCTYNGTNAKYPSGGARWEDISAKFGVDATTSAEEIKTLCCVEDYTLGAELYSATSMTKLDNTITYTAETIGAQVFDGVELAQGTNFVLYATVESGMTAENIGFVVGTLGEDNSKHLLFQWRKNQKDFYIWKDKNGWVGHADNLINSDIGVNGAQIALVYKNGKYYAFLNGAQVCSLGATFDNGWGGTVKLANTIGTEGTLKVGLSIAFGMAQFSEWGYSTEVDVINGYVPDPVEPPVAEDEPYTLGTEVYANTTMTKKDDVITYTAEKLGAQVFDSVEIAQGANFVLYATVEAGMTAENVGFVVGTLGEDNSNHLLFQWRKNQGDFYVWKDKGGWKGHKDNIFATNIGTSGAEIALVYKNGTYYAFLNGTLACQFDSTFNNGWGGKLDTASIVGTDGVLKVGLSVAFGTAQFSDWGYSTDENVIAQYVK